MTDERSTTMSNADDESTAASAHTLGSHEGGNMTDPDRTDEDVLRLIGFLEWLDCNREVTFTDLSESHEETALRYLKEEGEHGT
jgi:hypothetical protein